MCCPSACSISDINTNNAILADKFSINCITPIGFSPVVADPFFKLLQQVYPVPISDEDLEEMKGQIVGCSDDQIYSGQWEPENYIIVSLFSVIAFLIILGTAMDVFERLAIPSVVDETNTKKKGNLGYQMLRCFSLVENLSFIFSVPKGGSQRLGCLEGMRSMSMTWVILGHHFAFGPGLLHLQNNQQVMDIQSNHGGGILFEAVAEGEYSVDSFLFIGATLLSYLLLKDLDKSNGWFSSAAGIVRMILFYVNRYLRITIPYALVMAVFIGVIPLILKDNMHAGHLAYSEAEDCKRYMGYHMAYINIWPDYGGMLCVVL